MHPLCPLPSALGASARTILCRSLCSRSASLGHSSLASLQLCFSPAAAHSFTAAGGTLASVPFSFHPQWALPNCLWPTSPFSSLPFLIRFLTPTPTSFSHPSFHPLSSLFPFTSLVFVSSPSSSSSTFRRSRLSLPLEPLANNLFPPRAHVDLPRPSHLGLRN